MSGRGYYGRARLGAETSDPRFAARRRAVHAIFPVHDRTRAAFYVYSEVDGASDIKPFMFLDQANAQFFATQRVPGEVYVAIFDPTDRAWPDPAFDVYRASSAQTGALVGQGSFVPRAPTEILAELEQLNSEIEVFRQEAYSILEPFLKEAKSRLEANPEWQKARADELAVYARIKPWEALARETDRLRLAITNATSEGQLADLRVKLANAEVALEKAMPRARREALIREAQAASERRASIPMPEAHFASSPKAEWVSSTLLPFLDRWQAFYRLTRDQPSQTWFGSGAWDHIQDYRKQFVDIYKSAPFHPTTPLPTSSEGRRDVGLTDFFKELATPLKYLLYGGLGLAGVVVVAKVVQGGRRR